MPPLPVAPLRTNLGTWAVPDAELPAVAAALLDALPAEPFDPAFRGQELETTYFDTPDFALRKARRRGGQYLTLRVRWCRWRWRWSAAARPTRRWAGPSSAA